MRKACAVLYLVLLASGVLLAQTGSFHATSECGVALVHQMATLDDGRPHSISLDQRECRFQAPLDLGGVRIESYLATGTDDVQFDRSVDRGYAVGNSQGGDQYFLRYEGRAVMNGPLPVHLAGRWCFTGGSGRLKGLTGKGRYVASPTPDGRMVFHLEGHWKLSRR